MTQPIKTALSLLPLLGYLIFLIFSAYSKPLYTWDTVPYTATILSADIKDPQLLHTRTYEYLQRSLSPQQYASITSGAYAADLENNADHFISQLDMYRIKPAYVIALRTFTALGAEPLTSLRLLSLIPGVLFCLLLFAWLSRSCSTLGAALIVIAFAVVGRLAATATGDASVNPQHQPGRQCPHHCAIASNRPIEQPPPQRHDSHYLRQNRRHDVCPSRFCPLHTRRFKQLDVIAIRAVDDRVVAREFNPPRRDAVAREANSAGIEHIDDLRGNLPHHLIG